MKTVGVDVLPSVSRVVGHVGMYELPSERILEGAVWTLRLEYDHTYGRDVEIVFAVAVDRLRGVGVAAVRQLAGVGNGGVRRPVYHVGGREAEVVVHDEVRLRSLILIVSCVEVEGVAVHQRRRIGRKGMLYDRVLCRGSRCEKKQRRHCGRAFASYVLHIACCFMCLCEAPYSVGGYMRVYV